MKRTWKDNPKKNPEARRKRPYNIDGIRNESAAPERTFGRLGDPKHRSRSKNTPHVGIGEGFRRLARGW